MIGDCADTAGVIPAMEQESEGSMIGTRIFLMRLASPMRDQVPTMCSIQVRGHVRITWKRPSDISAFMMTQPLSASTMVLMLSTRMVSVTFSRRVTSRVRVVHTVSATKYSSSTVRWPFSTGRQSR